LCLIVRDQASLGTWGQTERFPKFDSIWLQLNCGTGGNAFVWFIRICSIPIARSINPDGSVVLTPLTTLIST